MQVTSHALCSSNWALGTLSAMLTDCRDPPLPTDQAVPSGGTPLDAQPEKLPRRAPEEATEIADYLHAPGRQLQLRKRGQAKL